MYKSHWVVVAFVATMVCNGSCRPREIDVRSIYPVYRSEKQLGSETPNRYEKPSEEKSDDDSISYHRIDIPYANGSSSDGELAVKNNSKSVIDYVPVALTIKKPNLKKWPSGQNGIESPDDLSLYNIYTNNINPLNFHHMTTPGYDLDFPYTSHSKPSILILEELTTRPFYDYDNVYTQPIQVLDRPPPRPVHFQQFYPPPEYPPPEYPPPEYAPPEYPPPEYPPPEYAPSEYPLPQYPIAPQHPDHGEHLTTVQETTTSPPTETQPPVTVTVQYRPPQTTPTPPETTTKKKNTRCPNVSITATTNINNNNSINKEGCQDIDIHISTDLNNSNVGQVRPTKPPSDSEVGQIGFFGIFDGILAIISRIFNFSFLGGVFSQFSSFFAGLSAVFLPWLFPHLLLQSIRKQRRVGLANKSFDGGGFDLKRVDLQSAYSGWSPRKKISSSPPPAVEAEPKQENVSKPSGKLDIESIATVARASNDGPPLPPPTAFGHVLDTVSQLVESDIRTPPKLKEIIKEKANEHRKDALGEHSTPLPYTFIYDDDIGKFEKKHEATDSTLLDISEGKASGVNIKNDEGVKGIAIPVVMDDDYEITAPPKKLQKIPEVPKPGKEDKKKTGVNKSQPTTTPSSGLSTWILLSDNKDVTTPLPKKNPNKKEDEKKKLAVTTTTKKPAKTQSTTQKSTTLATKKVTAKPQNKKPETETTGMSALEALVKNQKKGGTTTSKPKPTDNKKKVPERLEVAETKDKVAVELPESIATHTLPPNLQVYDEKAVTTMSSQSSTQTTTESAPEGTTKKKTTTKKKKKNKNRKKKPNSDTGVEAKIPPQAVGSQIYNFLSREIVPTVGLGLIGVALTAGLASFLGYNPFGSSTIPLRRTYDTHHGYTPNYYNYNTDYGDGGQSEEVLFREVLSGMPEDSRYGLTHTDATYSDAYNRPDAYDSVKNPAYPTGTGYTSEKDVGSYDANYPQDYSSGYGTTYDTQEKKYPEVKEKYPVYTRETGTSFVYPETTGMTSAEKLNQEGGEKYTKTSPDTIERQPEALYRVASDSDLQFRNKETTVQGVSSQNSWHRIGSPMEAKKNYPMIEPGPRSMDLSKMDVKKRSKRAAESVIQKISPKRTKKANDVENEIDFEDSFNDSKFSQENDFPSTTTTVRTTTITAETTTSTETSTTVASSTTEEVKDAGATESSETYDTDNESTAAPPSSVSVLDVLKRLAQFKLRLGLNFLRSTTDIFSRYLDDIQRRVDESFANTTTTTVQYNRRKSPWSRIFFSRLNDDDDDSYRRKRSVLEENHFLGAMLTEDVADGRFSKSTKKDLGPSDKIFHQKKTAPKKYESKRTN